YPRSSSDVGIEIDNLKVFPQNPSLSDHYLITFDFFLLDYTPLSNSYYTRCLSDSAVAKFKEKITPSLNSIPVKAALPKPAEGKVHDLNAGDYVVVRELRRKNWKARRWNGSFQTMITTTHRTEQDELCALHQHHPLRCHSIPSPSVTEVSHTDFNLSRIDHLVDSAVGSLRTTHDSVAPLKMKLTKQRKFAPWYNSQTRKLKQISRKFERNWRLTKLEESRLIWTDSLKTYKRGLHNARANYYSALIEENKNNPRFLFSTRSSAVRTQSCQYAGMTPEIWHGAETLPAMIYSAQT
ncbi:uncharacterized protein LOC144464273, partial [Epinephelus lanceolatus]